MIKVVIIDYSMTQLIVHNTLSSWPPAIAEAPERVQYTLLEFFVARLRNSHTRRAYRIAIEAFLGFSASMEGGRRLETITSLHVATWVEIMGRDGLTPPTIKQRLAAVRMFFRTLVERQILASDPTATVRGPAYVVRKGKTPILTGDETRQLMDSIPLTTLMGKRDRALIATMSYSFGRISAVLGLRTCDAFRQSRRLWLRFQEKGGRVLDVPCHHELEDILADWIDAAGLAETPDAPLFQSFSRTLPYSGGQRMLSGRAMSQSEAWQMLQRRAKAAGIDTAICNHTFRATGITVYLKNRGTLEQAAIMAGHQSTRTTQLYDRRLDEVTLDEVEKIRY